MNQNSLTDKYLDIKRSSLLCYYCEKGFNTEWDCYIHNSGIHTEEIKQLNLGMIEIMSSEWGYNLESKRNLWEYWFLIISFQILKTAK